MLSVNSNSIKVGTDESKRHFVSFLHKRRNKLEYWLLFRESTLPKYAPKF